MYGLYKQAKDGYVKGSQPWAIQMEARPMWDAWNENKYITRFALPIPPPRPCLRWEWMGQVVESGTPVNTRMREVPRMDGIGGTLNGMHGPGTPA